MFTSPPCLVYPTPPGHLGGRQGTVDSRGPVRFSSDCRFQTRVAAMTVAQQRNNNIRHLMGERPAHTTVHPAHAFGWRFTQIAPSLSQREMVARDGAISPLMRRPLHGSLDGPLRFPPSTCPPLARHPRLSMRQEGTERPSGMPGTSSGSIPLCPLVRQRHSLASTGSTLRDLLRSPHRKQGEV